MSGIGSIKLIKKPKPAKLKFASVRKEIIKRLEKLGKLHIQERNKIVANFNTKIKFGQDIEEGPKQIVLVILVTNSNQPLKDSDWTVGKLWRALDRTGTRPHSIEPKRQGGKLRFAWGGPGSYTPKTRPIGRSGGPGRVRNAKAVYRDQVKHPGFKPRKFSKRINKRLAPQFKKAISQGVRIGFKRR